MSKQLYGKSWGRRRPVGQFESRERACADVNSCAELSSAVNAWISGAVASSSSVCTAYLHRIRSDSFEGESKRSDSDTHRRRWLEGRISAPPRESQTYCHF
jgi:hypothetical protein